MHIIIKSTSNQLDFLSNFFDHDSVKINWILDKEVIPEADLYFDFTFEDEGYFFSSITKQPVLVNAVIETSDLLPENAVRFNGWYGFMLHNKIEVASKQTLLIEEIAAIFKKINWKLIQAPDEPGMLSARVVAMIINEAYYGLGDCISSKAAIDTAMKLGTNYPFGPFEWSDLIGLKKVYQLLSKLAETSRRYAVAPAMEKELGITKTAITQ